MKIIAWNANSIRNKLQELREFLPRFQVDVALICETYLKPSHRANIANYICYRNDRLTGKGGGTAIYIKSTIDHYLLPTPPDLEMEITSIMINTSKGPLAIISGYNHPRHLITSSDISTIFAISNSVILAGDLNAKHIDWHSKVINGNGRRLRQYSNKIGFEVNAPTSPTRIPPVEGHPPDVLDVVAFKNAIISPDIEVAHELSSDHLPILFSWGLGHNSEYNSVLRHRTSWKDFSKRLDDFSLPDCDLNLDQKVTLLEEHVQEALRLSTSSRLVPESFDIVPDEILNLIKARRKSIKLYQRTRAPQHRIEMNNLNFRVKNALNNFRNEKWQEKLESLGPEDGTLWSLTKNLRKPRAKIGVLSSADGHAVTDREKAELFADSLYNIASDSTINYPEHLNILFNMNQNLDRLGKDLEPATADEVKSLISGLKTKTAPGLDGISNTAVKFLPANIIDSITSIINDVLTSRIFPHKWKQARVIMIHKTGKTKTDVNNYRPISLLPTLGKLTERVILSRLYDECESLNIIPPEQFGFRALHGTELQLLRLTEEIHQSFEVKDTTVGVFLDIKRAFDTVWHEGLVAKLYQFNVNPFLAQLIENYLSDRSFVVSVDQSSSTPRALRAGLPQGSVISPTLYSIYTADFPSIDAVSLYTYADDTALVTSSRDVKLAHRRLQSALDTACKYFNTWKLTPHPDKSQHIVFTTRMNPPSCPLSINGHTIPKCQVVKYLGVHFDSKLRWNDHITQTSKKSAQAMAMIYPLYARSSNLSLPNKLLVYKQIIRPMLTYGSLVWGAAAPSLIAKLQVQQNKFLRFACNAPRSTNMKYLQEELGIEPFFEYIKKINSAKLIKAAEHTNILVTDSLKYVPSKKFTRNRPKTFLIPPPDP